MLTHTKFVAAFIGLAALLLPRIPLAASTLAVEAGKQVTISVAAAGTAPFSYQWHKDGVKIAGATSASYVISPAAAADAGTYTALVSNPWGSVTSDAAVLTVTGTAVGAPVITKQPASVTVTQGSAATLSVTASGTSLTFQWYKNGAAISGATASTYAIASAALGDAGNYAVKISNQAGSVTSSTVSLTVNAKTVAPAITVQPVSVTVTQGNAAAFTVTATGSSLAYQWRKNGVAVSGATGSTYAISAAQTSDAGTYTVVISNSAGTATSSPATLTVNSAMNLAEIPPSSYTARGENGTAEGLAKLFDGDVSSKWLDFSASSWVKISFSKPTMLDAYSLASANDHSERDPASWTLSGSNDGVNWTVIEKRSGQSWGSRFQTRDFALVQRTGAYTQFRFDFQATSGSIVQLAELECYGVESGATPVQLFPTAYNARGENGIGEGLAKLFDGDPSSKWLDFSAATWVVVSFGKPTMLDAYTLTSANDHAERDPASWTLSGSNDGVNWTTIESRSGQSWTSRFQARDFVLAQRTAAYAYFRFDFRATGGSITQLADLEIYGVQSGSTTGTPTVQVLPAAYSARGENGTAEGLAKLFDGDVSTKWLDFSSTTWVRMSFAKPTMLDAYSLTSANDYVERDPASWTLSGSNDGVNWTVIETRSGQSWTSRFQARDFTLAQRTAAYTYFRFAFQAQAGGITQLAELELFGASSN